VPVQLLSNLGLTFAGVTTTQTSVDYSNDNCRGVRCVLDMTNVGTGSVTLSIQGKDKVSGKYFTLLAGLPVTTNTTTSYTVHPKIAASANVAARDVLPQTWRIVCTANNANATTYTVGACLLT
jgi:hypothetical protein